MGRGSAEAREREDADRGGKNERKVGGLKLDSRPRATYLLRIGGGPGGVEEEGEEEEGGGWRMASTLHRVVSKQHCLLRQLRAESTDHKRIWRAL